MMGDIVKYPVQHPLLKKYIKFFWKLHIDSAQLNHKIIPQRNINLRFNLSETPHSICINGKISKLDNVYFPGLHDRYGNTNLIISGRIDVLGICFFADGFYPFLKIPVSEFKNRLLGADEAGFKPARKISERLKEAHDMAARLNILENELVLLLNSSIRIPENFQQLFESLRFIDSSIKLNEFCRQKNIGMRKLERMFNKYIGVSANTYSTLNRFHISVSQILNNNYTKLSDLAYDNGYYDQMHFIKDFKRFTGDTPKDFVHQSNSILQIGKIK